MITKLYKEIQRLAGDKFAVGKIYKLETCIFPPSLNNPNPETFGSQLLEMAPKYPVGLEVVGDPIEINFDCEQEDLQKLLFDDVPDLENKNQSPKEGDIWRCMSSTIVMNGNEKYPGHPEIFYNDFYIRKVDNQLQAILLDDNSIRKIDDITLENGWSLINNKPVSTITTIGGYINKDGSVKKVVDKKENNPEEPIGGWKWEETTNKCDSWISISIDFPLLCYRPGWKGVYDHIKSILFKETIIPINHKQYKLSACVKSNTPIDFILSQSKILPKKD